MNKRTILLVVVVFVLIVAGMFTFAFLKRTELTTIPTPPVTTETETLVPYPNVTRIDAKHFFVDGVHTFVGQIELPTPCDLLQGETVVRESMPEQVTLVFTVINTAESCVETVTAQRFMLTATASEEAQITASFMGRVVPLNLIPAAPGETPEEFELFIKG